MNLSKPPQQCESDVSHAAQAGQPASVGPTAQDVPHQCETAPEQSNASLSVLPAAAEQCSLGYNEDHDPAWWLAQQARKASSVVYPRPDSDSERKCEGDGIFVNLNRHGVTFKGPVSDQGDKAPQGTQRPPPAGGRAAKKVKAKQVQNGTRQVRRSNLLNAAALADVHKLAGTEDALRDLHNDAKAATEEEDAMDEPPNEDSVLHTTPELPALTGLYVRGYGWTRAPLVIAALLVCFAGLGIRETISGFCSSGPWVMWVSFKHLIFHPSLVWGTLQWMTGSALDHPVRLGAALLVYSALQPSKVFVAMRWLDKLALGEKRELLPPMVAADGSVVAPPPNSWGRVLAGCSAVYGAVNAAMDPRKRRIRPLGWRAFAWPLILGVCYLLRQWLILVSDEQVRAGERRRVYTYKYDPDRDVRDITHRSAEKTDCVPTVFLYAYRDYASARVTLMMQCAQYTAHLANNVTLADDVALVVLQEKAQRIGNMNISQFMRQALCVGSATDAKMLCADAKAKMNGLVRGRGMMPEVPVWIGPIVALALYLLSTAFASIKPAPRRAPDRVVADYIVGACSGAYVWLTGGGALEQSPVGGVTWLQLTLTATALAAGWWYISLCLRTYDNLELQMSLTRLRLELSAVGLALRVASGVWLRARLAQLARHVRVAWGFLTVGRSGMRQLVGLAAAHGARWLLRALILGIRLLERCISTRGAAAIPPRLMTDEEIRDFVRVFDELERERVDEFFHQLLYGLPEEVPEPGPVPNIAPRDHPQPWYRGSRNQLRRPDRRSGVHPVFPPEHTDGTLCTSLEIAEYLSVEEHYPVGDTQADCLCFTCRCGGRCEAWSDDARECFTPSMRAARWSAYHERHRAPGERASLISARTHWRCALYSALEEAFKQVVATLVPWFCVWFGVFEMCVKVAQKPSWDTVVSRVVPLALHVYTAFLPWWAAVPLHVAYNLHLGHTRGYALLLKNAKACYVGLGYRGSEVRVKSNPTDAEFKLKVSFHSSRLDNEMKIMQMALTDPPVGVAPPIADRADGPTLMQGAASRVGRKKAPYSTKERRNFERFCRALFHRNFQALRSDFDLAFDTWLSQTPYPEWRKAELREAYLSLVDGKFSKRQTRCVIFSKTETYLAYKLARAIISRHDAFKAFFGPVAKAMESEVYSHGEFIKHVPVADRPEYIQRYFDGWMGPYWESDYTSFEAQMDADSNLGIMNIVEMQFYKHMLKAFPAIYAAIRGVLTGVNVCDCPFFTMRLKGRRMSGEMCTSLGNGITNYAVLKYIAYRSGVEVRFVVEGDDGLSAFSGPVDTSVFELLGLRVKLERHDSLFDASFCGLRLAADSTLLVNPVKVLLNFAWSHSAEGFQSARVRRELLAAKAQSLACESPDCPVVCAVAQHYLRETQGVRARAPRDWYDQQRLGAAEDKRWEKKLRAGPSLVARVDFDRIYGMSHAYQLLLEAEIHKCGLVGPLVRDYLMDMTSPDCKHYWDHYVRTGIAPGR